MIDNILVRLLIAIPGIVFALLLLSGTILIARAVARDQASPFSFLPLFFTGLLGLAVTLLIIWLLS